MMNKFNPGDRVICTRNFVAPEDWATKYRGVYTVRTASEHAVSLVETFQFDGEWANAYFELVISSSFSTASIQEFGVIPMDLKDVKKVNLKEAKKQVLEERANAEVSFAKQQLRAAQDEIDRLDREIKQREESKKPFLDIIKQFE